MAECDSQAEADRFGRTHLSEFCGESVEVEMASRADAEEFWCVRTVKLMNVRLDPEVRPATAAAVADRKSGNAAPQRAKFHFVFGLNLTASLEGEEDLLTPEDRAAIALDHIERTSDVVVRFEIRKFA
jgi:hypothetical protein